MLYVLCDFALYCTCIDISSWIHICKTLIVIHINTLTHVMMCFGRLGWGIHGMSFLPNYVFQIDVHIDTVCQYVKRRRLWRMKHSVQKGFLKESFVYRIINEEGWFQRKNSILSVHFVKFGKQMSTKLYAWDDLVLIERQKWSKWMFLSLQKDLKKVKK